MQTFLFFFQVCPLSVYLFVRSYGKFVLVITAEKMIYYLLSMFKDEEAVLVLGVHRVELVVILSRLVDSNRTINKSSLNRDRIKFSFVC